MEDPTNPASPFVPVVEAATDQQLLADGRNEPRHLASAGVWRVRADAVGPDRDSILRAIESAGLFSRGQKKPRLTVGSPAPHLWRFSMASTNKVFDEVKADTASWGPLAEVLQTERLRDVNVETEVGIGLWSVAPFNRSELHFAFGHADPAQWNVAVLGPFEHLVGRLTKMNRLAVRLAPRCGSSIALRAGALVHARTGFRVECLGPDGEYWDLDPQPVPIDAPIDVLKLPTSSYSGMGGEFHLVLSVSTDVRGAYFNWASERNGRSPEVALEIRPVTGPNQSAVDPIEVVDWARSVMAQFRRNIRHGSSLVRLFLSCPEVLAMALGREMNAIGRVIVMEFDNEAHTYFEGVEFGT